MSDRKQLNDFIVSRSPGEVCGDTCDGLLELIAIMFYWRGVSTPGVVCTKCKGLWDYKQRFLTEVLAKGGKDRNDEV